MRGAPPTIEKHNTLRARLALGILRLPFAHFKQNIRAKGSAIFNRHLFKTLYCLFCSDMMYASTEDFVKVA